MASMLPAELKRAHERQPFRPFVVRTGDGREYRVPHPDFMYIYPSGRTAIVVQDDDSGEHIDVFLITSLHFPRRRGGGENGQSGNGRKR